MSTDPAIYRLKRRRRGDVAPKNHRGSLALIDEATQQILATCEVLGQVAFATHEILDDKRAIWRMAPNRRIMPSRWRVTDPDGRIVLQFEQQILRKLANPLRRTGLALLDANGRETARLVDSRTGVLDRMIGPGTDDWILVRDDAPIAKLARLPTPEPPVAGMLGRLGRLLTQADRGLVSLGPRHALPPAEALALMMLVEELMNPSGVG